MKSREAFIANITFEKNHAGKCALDAQSLAQKMFADFAAGLTAPHDYSRKEEKEETIFRAN